MMNNGDSLLSHFPTSSSPPATVLQIAIDALTSIVTAATKAVTTLQGGQVAPEPVRSPAVPAPALGSSQDAELAALERAMPADAVALMRSWSAQLRAPSASPVAVRGLPNNVVTVQAYWWGFHFRIPHAVMAQWEGGGATASGIVGAAGAVLAAIPAAGPAAPFVAVAAAYIAAEFGLMQAVDRGYGCFLSMSWFAPGIFVPTTMSASD